MIVQQKYLLTLTISHIISALVVINKAHCRLEVLMYIYIFLPAIILIATRIIYKYMKAKLMYVVSFIVFLSCCCMFWLNEEIVKEIFLYRPTYPCIIYLVIIIFGAIVMPFTRPNSFFGIRIQQTEDYPEVWQRTHIFTSLILSLVVLPTTIALFYFESDLSFFFCNVFLIVPLVLGIIYAVIITIPIEKAEKKQMDKELEEQIKKEQGYR